MSSLCRVTTTASATAATTTSCRESTQCWKTHWKYPTRPTRPTVSYPPFVVSLDFRELPPFVVSLDFHELSPFVVSPDFHVYITTECVIQRCYTGTDIMQGSYQIVVKYAKENTHKLPCKHHKAICLLFPFPVSLMNINASLELLVDLRQG